MQEPMSVEEAAIALNRSVRTVQRMMAAGKLRTEERDGRTLVLVERPSGAAIAQLQRQADDTGKVAALAAVTGERAALAYHERAVELERQVAEARRAMVGWRVTAVASLVAGVATLVTLAWTAGDTLATRDTVTATEARATLAERELVRAQTALERSEADRERLTALVVEVTRRDIVAAIDAGQAAARGDLSAH